ncbi:hypothetical protein PV327_008914 [Microctonus hyperodae]|nr:hypothetical protein PV327_008914 [Microctonus hyperodae]
MVYIHGGSFICGSGEDVMFGPDYLIEREIVLVTINYRVGIFDSKAKNPFLSIPLHEAIKNGIKIPTMCGYLSHEGIIVIAGMNDDMYNEINADVENLLIHPTAKKILNKYNLTVNDVKQFYFGDGKMCSKNIEKIVDVMSTVHFILGIHDVIEIQSKIPHAPMYVYKFEYEVETSLLKKFLNVEVKGTCHGEELSFLFYQKLTKLLDKQIGIPGSIEHDFIEKFTKMWTDFAKTGNPTPQLTNEIPVEWKPVDNSDGYKCLLITNKLNMITEMKITQQLRKSIKNKL